MVQKTNSTLLNVFYDPFFLLKILNPFENIELIEKVTVIFTESAPRLIQSIFRYIHASVIQLLFPFCGTQNCMNWTLLIEERIAKKWKLWTNFGVLNFFLVLVCQDKHFCLGKPAYCD